MTLYDILVSIDQNFRFAALSAIANPKIGIVHQKWASSSGKQGCLFVTAASAGRRIHISKVPKDFGSIATLLGLEIKSVEDGIHYWDSMSRMQRRKLRARIRSYVETTYPVVTEFTKTTVASRTPLRRAFTNSVAAGKVLVGI